MNFGASLFPTTTVTDITSAVTGAITDNIAVVVGLVALWLGIRVGFKLFRGATHGKAKI